MTDPEEYKLIDHEQAEKIKKRSGNGWKWVALCFILGTFMLIGGLMIRSSLSDQTCKAVQTLREDIIHVLEDQRTSPEFLKAARVRIGRPQCS